MAPAPSPQVSKLGAPSPQIPFRPRFCESWSTDYTADRFWYQDHVLSLVFVGGAVVGAVVVSRSAYAYASAYATAAP